MEPGQAHRIGSLGSSLSRSENIFSLSSFQVEDDEEALKWVALEKLPTYSRIKKTVQPGPDGRFVEVDVQNIKGQERKKLLERLVPAAGDNAVFMQKFKNRLDRVGIDLPTVEVRFEHIKVEAETYISVRALPTIYNMFVNLLEAVASSLHIIPRQKKSIPILRDISGIIKPKGMTLLLGSPGSGKTTLLLALAGRLSLDLKVSGKVSYNGHELKEFVPQKTAAYISQYDLHIEMLLEILRREKAAGIKPDPDMDAFMKAASMDGQDASVVTDYILKILGLEVCADTMVGNEMLRGVSRGQRRRVTIGEILVGPARALFIDEISTGLDSSTIFQIVNSLGQYINILGGTAVISLLQPAPETYDLFDDIILLSDGDIAYQGPREHALEFFDSMGFKCPERKGIADFLQEVTSRKDQQQYWVRQDEPYRSVSAEEFTEAFLFFHAGQKLKDELAVPFDKSTSHPDALVTSIYGVSKLELLKACIARELLLMDRNLIIYVSSITQIVLLAFITITVFLRSKMHHDSEDDGRLFRGALFVVRSGSIKSNFFSMHAIQSTQNIK